MTTARDESLPWHDVVVHWTDGTSHADGIRGADRADAESNAQWNWIEGNPYDSADSIEYVGVATDDDAACL